MCVWNLKENWHYLYKHRFYKELNRVEFNRCIILHYNSALCIIFYAVVLKTFKNCIKINMLKICNNLDEYIENLVAESYELIFLEQRFS